MKNRFRAVAVAALFAAALAGGCCNDCKKSEMMDDKNAMNDKGMMKQCAKCGMACDAKGMCPHCDAGKMAK